MNAESTERKYFCKISIVISLLLVLILGVCLYLLSLPFSYEELDLNDNGLLSFEEIGYVTSYGEREVMHKGKKCIEYYALKDGLPLKVVCILKNR